MIRYIKQRDKYNCGPVAVLNALKWAGKKVTYASDFKKIKEACKSGKKNGTYVTALTDALIKYKLIRRRDYKSPATTKDIDTWLKKGNAVIVRYGWWKKSERKKVNQYATRLKKGKWIGHYVLISGHYVNSKWYVIHNVGRSWTVWSKRKLRHYLSNTGSGESDVWFIRKS